ncbi:MAG: hypothetical protein FWC70_11235 [Defluviitaleaceae bacterium]|nr:hypothetical protein [Defluviitaleaceae bacterium]
MALKTWSCPTCGNVNSDYLKEKCVRCNWGDFDPARWGDTPYNEIEKFPGWLGFGWDCPVCENKNAGDSPDFDVCQKCGWENDLLQFKEPDYWGGANSVSLNTARLEYSLEMNEATRPATIQARKAYSEVRRNIYRKYTNIDHKIVDGDKCRDEHFANYEQFVAALQAIHEGRG